MTNPFQTSISPLPEEGQSLWGDDGLLARFTRAVKNINDIAERCRKAMVPRPTLELAALALCLSRGQHPEGHDIRPAVDGRYRADTFLELARADAATVIKAIRPEGNGNRANIINEYIDSLIGPRNGIETRRAETGTGSVHESPVSSEADDAPETQGNQRHDHA